jgi:hypothetical protein
MTPLTGSLVENRSETCFERKYLTERLIAAGKDSELIGCQTIDRTFE